MRKRKLKIFLTPTENSIVIQSLNTCVTPCSGKTGIPAAWMNFCSK